MQRRLGTATSVFLLSKADLPAASHMRLILLLSRNSVETLWKARKKIDVLPEKCDD